MRAHRRERVIASAIRCYPSRWQSRHREEATLLASALLDDGVSWWSIAWSFLGGAAREQVLRRPSLGVRTTLAALTIGAGALSLGLFASLSAASASSTNIVIIIRHPYNAARQLETAIAEHHLRITVTERTASTKLVGSIVSLTPTGSSASGERAISELRGPCVNGAVGCVDGLIVPPHYSGSAVVVIGRSAKSR